jgi:hypothetical protein
MFSARSRFIPDVILDRFECRAWPIAITDGESASGSDQRTDIAARMREMWH